MCTELDNESASALLGSISLHGFGVCVFISKPDLGFVTQATSGNYRAGPQPYFDRLMDRSLNEHVYKSATKSQKGSIDDLVSGNKSCSNPERHCRAQSV